MKFSGLTTQDTAALRQGAGDAFGNAAEPAISNGGGVPCRHCLRLIPEGAPYLIFAHKPFETTQPYSEIGPIFVCAQDCAAPDGTLPQVLETSQTYLLKAYSKDERIIYGTGAIVTAGDVTLFSQRLLDRPDVAFVDARSASNNCWIARITRN